MSATLSFAGGTFTERPVLRLYAGSAAKSSRTSPRPTTAAHLSGRAARATTPRGSAPTAVAPLALTARGRRVLRAAAVLAGIGLILALALLGGRAIAGGPASPTPVDTYTVSAGETLWAIASSYTAPHDDVRETIAALVDLNSLSGSALRAGEQILVPAEWAALAE